MVNVIKTYGIFLLHLFLYAILSNYWYAVNKYVNNLG